MKKIFTKTIGFVAAIILFVGIALPACAQFVKKSYESTNEFYTAVTKDANGNIYAIRSADGVHASVIKYAPNSTSFTTLFSGLAAGGGDESNAGFLAWGLAVNSLGDVYCTTNLSAGNTGAGTNVVNGVALTNHGNVIKLASNNGFNGTVYTASVFLNGGLFYTSLAFDASNNLYVVQTDNTSLSHYTVRRYPAGSTSGTELFNDLNDDATDNYPHGLAVASNGDIYVCDAGQKVIGGTSGHKGGVRHYVNSGGTYSSHTNVSLNTYPMALALDGSGSLYVSETDGTAYANYRLNKYDASSHALTSGNVTTLVANSGVLPDGIAAVNSHDIYVAGGGNPSEFFELIGPATTTASGINFTATATTSTTINWTNGDGAGRAVFVALASSGTPTPVNSTNYTANTNFGSGTQAGSGWYCVFNATTGTSVNVTGLTAGNTYRAMVVEYNGSVALTSENYLTTSNSGNTANVATLSPTTINSLNRVTSTVTNASSVSFAAVFGTAVTGVTASNFSVTTTGVSGVTNANIGTLTTSDNITWTVPVSTGTGDGTIQLNLANATGLSKTISTSLPFAGQAYTIDKTAPTISIGAPSLSGTNAGPVTYTVTYADANFNSSTLANGDITLNTTGSATGTPVVTGSGLTRTVTISGITGNGTLGISIAANTATDLAGNSAPAAGPSTTFTVDNVVPTVTIARTDGNPIHDNVLDFQAVFSEAVTGVDGSDFTLTTTGGITSGTISVTPLNATTYNVTVINVSGTGTARLDLNGSGTGITDAGGNAPAGFTGGEVYTVDQTAPTVSSINIAGTSPTNASSVDYTVTFSEAVTGVDGADFTVTKTGNANGSVTGVTGSGTTYTVTVGSVSGNGTLRLDLNGSGTAIVDGAGNPISGGFTGGQTYTIDTTIPTLTSGSYFSNNAFSSQYAKVGDNITLTIGYNEVLQSLTMTIGGNAVSVTPSNGNKNWTGVYTMTSSDTEGNVGWTLSATDLAGNVRNYSNNDFGTVLIFDKTGPAVNIAAPSVASVGSGTGSTVTYAVTYADANFNFSTLSTSDITLNTTGTATGTIGLSGSGSSYTVTISGITGLGTLGISIGANTAQDIPGNLATASAPSTTFSVFSSDATLSNLTTTAGTISPAFTPSITSGYTASVPNATTSITVTPTTTDSNTSDLEVSVNGGQPVSVVSGTQSAALPLIVGSNTIAIQITAQDGTTTKTYTLTVNRAPSTNALLSKLTFNPATKLTWTHGAGPNFADYTANIYSQIGSVNVIPVTADNTATVTVNGVPATSGVETTVTLKTDTTAIAVTVTAADGVTKKTYRIVVTHVPSNNALLSALRFNPTTALTWTHGAGPNYADYTANVYSQIGSVNVIPVTADNTATVTVNGVLATSGTETPVTLKTDTTAIAVTVTAADGITKKTYRIMVTHIPSNIALLSKLTLDPTTPLTWTHGAGPNYADYTANVANSVSSVKVIPVTTDNTSTVTVNGLSVISGAESAPVTLNADTTSIAVTITAADGTTKKTYAILVTRQPVPPIVMVYDPSKEAPLQNTPIVVHQNVSPNGDGNSDALVIEGIAAHPDNKLQIMSRSGTLVYEAKGYDNATKSFDGHSSTNGKLQQPGTYFYSLEYKDGNETKHKTGFIVLKY